MRQPYEIVREKFVSPELCAPLTRERVCSGNEIDIKTKNWEQISIPLHTKLWLISIELYVLSTVSTVLKSALCMHVSLLDNIWRHFWHFHFTAGSTNIVHNKAIYLAALNILNRTVLKFNVPMFFILIAVLQFFTTFE